MMKTKLLQCRLPRFLLAMALVAGAGNSQALTLTFDYSYDSSNFFNDSIRKNILQTAGDFFGQRITDNLAAISSSGNNHFNVNFTNPSSGVNTTINDYSVAADTLVIYAGARDLGSPLGQGGPGGYSASGTSQSFFDSLDRGQNGDDFGPWGGSIAFSNTASWYFDSDLSTTESFAGSDFYSVALHEIGHVLGYGTAVSWSNKVDSGTATFTGANAEAANGGSAVPLANSSHWQNALTSTVDGVGSQEVAMDPSLTTGTRKVFTDLDLAGLKDIGWQVTPVPIPAAVYLFGSGLLGLLGLTRRRHA